MSRHDASRPHLTLALICILFLVCLWWNWTLQVKVLYVRNLTQDFSEEKLKESFELHGAVQRVKKMKDYAFVHFEERQDAVNAMSELNGAVVHGATLEVSLAKPPSDRKKKEEVLKARERRLIQQHIVHRGPSGATGQVCPHHFVKCAFICMQCGQSWLNIPLFPFFYGAIVFYALDLVWKVHLNVVTMNIWPFYTFYLKRKVRCRPNFFGRPDTPKSPLG